LVLSLTGAKEFLRLKRGKQSDPILSTLPEALNVMGQITIEQRVKAVDRESNKQSIVFALRSPFSHRSDQVAIASTNRLKSCSHSELRKLFCKTERGILIICGQVGSFYWKQLAQEIIRPISQSMFIENQLEVRSAVSYDTQYNPSE
jgi:hypothetical protein